MFFNKKNSSSIKTKTTREGNKYEFDESKKHFCKLLTVRTKEFSVPDDLIAIMDGAFSSSSCQSTVDALKTIVIPEEIQRIGDKSFNNCPSLESITVENGNEDFSDSNGVLFNRVKAVLRRYPEGKHMPNEKYSIPQGVVTIQNYAFYHCEFLKSIKLTENVTTIGAGAFFDCSGLTEITIPKGVETIGANAFEGCSGVTKVDIPDSVKEIGNNAFFRCTKLETVKLPKKLDKLGNFAFGGCEALQTINIPQVKEKGYAIVAGCPKLSLFECWRLNSTTSGSFSGEFYKIPKGTTRIEANQFRGQWSLKSIAIPKSVESIGENAFYGCASLTAITTAHTCRLRNPVVVLKIRSNRSSLKTVVIPDSVKNIGAGAFGFCSSLKSIVVPKSVTKIENRTFVGCSSLSSLTLPDEVTSIGDRAFHGCSSLSSFVIPSGVTSIGDCAFGGCSSLSSLVIPSNVTSIAHGAFSHCSSLMKIEVDEDNPNYCSIDGALFTKDQTTLLVCPAERQGYSVPSCVTSIGDRAFWGCSSLSSLTLPDGVTSIEHGAFWGCSSLSSLTLPDGVTSIGDRAFEGCSSLSSLTLPDGVTSIGDCTFSGCSSLSSLVIPSSVTEIRSFAFQRCSSLSSLVIPSSVTSIGPGAFWGCSSLSSLTLPDGVTSIGDWAFWGCSSLVRIEVDENNPEYCSIDGALFTKDQATLILCPPGRQDYSIPSCVTYIERGAFCGCTSLSSVIIPSSVTSIRDDAFWGCSSLVRIEVDENNPKYCSIDGALFTKDQATLIRCPQGKKDYSIPSCVTYIERGAFSGCARIEVDENNPKYCSIDGALFTKDQTTLIVCPPGKKDYSIPSSVTSIRSRAFQGCDLSSLVIPSSVTDIGSYAFKGCSSLSSLVIPSSVTSIGDWAFWGCHCLIIRVPKGSYAEEYAKKHRIEYVTYE